jgi:hypothetical protein
MSPKRKQSKLQKALLSNSIQNSKQIVEGEIDAILQSPKSKLIVEEKID